MRLIAPSRLVVLLAFLATLLFAFAASAQTTTTMTQYSTASIEDQMKDWPTIFDGITSMGPYKWVDGPSYVKNNPNMTYAVTGVPFQQWICRAYYKDGTHIGKLYSGNCNIGWGGSEIVLSTGFEALVMDQTKYASYFPQAWQPSTATTGFWGSTSPKMRVCRAMYQNAPHVGKEWSGNCNIGWGGKEIVIPASQGYNVLELSFAKDAWQKSLTTTNPYTTQPSTVNISGNTGTFLQPQPQPTLDVTSGYKGITDLMIMRDTSTGAYLMPNFAPKAQLYPGGARSLAVAGKELTTDPADPWQNYAETWFRRVAAADGFFQIKFLDTELCVDGGTAALGSVVKLAACTGSNAQLWTTYVAPAGGSPMLRSALYIQKGTDFAVATGASSQELLCMWTTQNNDGQVQLTDCLNFNTNSAAAVQFGITTVHVWGYKDASPGGVVLQP